MRLDYAALGYLVLGVGGTAPELSLLLVNTASESICGIKVANENW